MNKNVYNFVYQKKEGIKFLCLLAIVVHVNNKATKWGSIINLWIIMSKNNDAIKLDNELPVLALSESRTKIVVIIVEQTSWLLLTTSLLAINLQFKLIFCIIMLKRKNYKYLDRMTKHYKKQN